MLLLSSSPVLTLATRVIRRRGVGDPAFCGTSVTRTSLSRCSAFVGGSMTARVHLLPGGPPPLDTVTELRQLVDDLTELGDTATAALVRKATDKFMAWKFEAGERLLERALEERRKHEHEPPRSP